MSRRFPVPPKQVWAVLADGRSYARWVVGTRRIRSVDDDWPKPGSALHFTVGRWPLRHEDRTVVRAARRRRRLELEAFGWPLGTARVGVRLRRQGRGTLVTIEEHPLKGLAARLHNRVVDALLWARGRRMLRHLHQHVVHER